MSSPSTSPTPSPDSEDLFDRWLDAALAGEVEDPAAFCERFDAAPTVLVAIQRIAQQLRGMQQPGGTEPQSGQATPATDAPGTPHRSDQDLPYQTLGEFRLLRRLGEGGMGTVFLAEQPSLDRLVALKVMRAEMLASKTAQQRFDLEARAVARLRHPNVVTMFGSGEDHGVRYLVMELVPGQSLDEVFASNPPRAEQLVRWCREVATALATAHAEGILHRDVKPSNIRIDPSQRAVLLDFGLARDLLEVGAAQTLAFAGSPHYASPEQRRGDRDAIDHRSDIYSLGVVLYEGLCGSLPYVGTTLEAIAQEAATSEPMPVRRRNPAIAQDLAVVVGKAMEASPSQRYATMQEFAADLTAVLELRPVAAMAPSRHTRLLRWCRRHRSVVATASVMAAALLLVLGLWLRQWFAEAQERRDESARLVQEAAADIDDYRARRDQFAIAAQTSYNLIIARRERYLTPDEDAFLQLHSVHREIHWGSTDALFASIGEKLRTAESLTPGATAVDEVWAKFWFERWADHRTSDGWRALVGFARKQVERLDHDGDEQPRLLGASSIAIVSDPPGAEVHLFRSIEAADVGREQPLEPPERLPGERRMTRQPARRAGSLLGTAPIRAQPIERGEYVIELRMPGHEALILPIVVPYRAPEEPLRRTYQGRLLPNGTTPPGFVRVSDARGRWPGVLVQTREVTCSDYLQFLNSSSQHTRHASPPRPLGRQPWPQLTAGKFALPDEQMAEHPVVGVSFGDATAYAAWWNEQHELSIDGTTYEARLPTRKQWRRAGGAVNQASFRQYVFGNYFSPHWCKSRFAKPSPALEPVQSYASDVSMYGVYDLAGSAAEWCADFLDVGKTLRPLCGGSWQDSHEEVFRIDSVRGLDAGAAGLHTGFRLVWAPR